MLFFISTLIQWCMITYLATFKNFFSGGKNGHMDWRRMWHQAKEKPECYVIPEWNTNKKKEKRKENHNTKFTVVKIKIKFSDHEYSKCVFYHSYLSISLVFVCHPNSYWDRIFFWSRIWFLYNPCDFTEWFCVILCIFQGN